LSTPAAKAEEVEAAVESEEAAEAAEAEAEGEGKGEEVGEEGENGCHRRRRAAGRGSSIRRSPLEAACRTPPPATAATPRRVRMYLRRLRGAG
tara:strand:- start:150 stop:428 length:279 start_codon:yes stop_codon:yes gene_type:complete